MYVGREEKVADLFYVGTNSWDVGRVRGLFTTIDADAILATFVPQRLVGDRIAWAKSNDGLYDVKTGYQYWQGRNNSSLGTVPQSGGWKRIWRLPLPHKMKVFLWRLCRNNIHVPNRLKGKGVSVTILCPFCNVDVEHLTHVFFDCIFAASCWLCKGFQHLIGFWINLIQLVLRRL